MNKSKKKILLIAVIILLLIIGVLTVFGVGIYKYQWTDPFVLQTAELIPYPAALVNGKIVKYSKWMDSVKDLKYFYDQEKELNLGLVDALTDEEIEADELDHQIDLVLLNQIAKEYQIKVTTQDVDNEFEQTIVPQAAGGEEEIAATLKDLYNWEITDFKEKIVKEMVLRDKINEALGQSDKQAEKKAEAEEVLAKINSGELTFEEAAQQYSEDSSASQGGDLGYFSKGVMVQNFEDVAFSLEPGQVSDVFLTKYGYHIIKVEDKKTKDEEEQVHARHILIMLYGVDDLLEERTASAKIKKFF